MTQITTTKRICEHLEKYVYDRIWNEPYTEYRTYTRPVLLNKSVVVQKPVYDSEGKFVDWEETTSVTPASGFFSGRYSRILLPPHKSPDDLDHWLPTDSNKFFVYAIPDRFFDSIKVNITEWTLLSDYCNENCVDFHVFTPSGFCLNRGAIYLCQADMNDCMILAIDADMVQELIGNFDEVGDVLFGKYIDSDQVADNQIYVKQLENYDDSHNWDDFTYLLYNGKLVTGNYKTVSTPGAYIEGVTDVDIIGYFEVSCNAGERPTYYNGTATAANERLLVHVPSKFNPNRYLITPHTCDMWLVPTEMSSGTPIISGSYISLAGMEDVVHQITHNDFSINMPFLTNIASTHHFTKYKLRVYVRLHNKKKEFVRDYNYIDMLYNLEDDEITQFLLGTHEWQQTNDACEFDSNVSLYWYKDATVTIGWSCVQNITTAEKFEEEKNKTTEKKLYKTPSNMLLFWKADHLEDCKYANALIRRRGGHYQSAETQCTLCPNYGSCLAEKVRLEEKQEAGTATAWEIARIAELKSYGISHTAGTPYVLCEKFIKIPSNQCSLCGLKQDTMLDGTVKSICTRGTTDYDCPYYHVRSMRDYVQILGYFHVLSLVGKRVWHFKLTDKDVFNYTILAPLALSYPELNITDFHCIVYHNGYRVDQDRITVSSTNRETVGAEEMEHGTGCLSRSTMVIQSNFATKMQVSIKPIYEATPDHRISADRTYYKYNSSSEYETANICSSKDEFDEMTREQQLQVDYIVDDLINKNDPTDPESEYVATTDEYFTTRVYYAREVEEEEFNPILLVPGEEGDYKVGDNIAEWMAEHPACRGVYVKRIHLYTAKEEFCKDDTVAIEVFDNRLRINEETKAEEPGIQFLTKWTSSDPREITTYTDNQYKLYIVTTTTSTTGETRFRYEKIPDSNVGELVTNPSGTSFTLTINPEYNSNDLLFVEGPKVVENSCSRTINSNTFGYLGKEFNESDTDEYEGELAYPLDSTIMFMNNKRLIPNLDYYLDTGDTTTYNDQIIPYVQNLSYIWNGTRATQVEDEAKINYIRSNTTEISTQYGFMIGKKVTWAGQAPFWFDELSTLTIDGALCSNFKHSLGMVTVTDSDHRNGSPYEIRTACSTRVMEIVGCQDEQPGDIQKIREIRTFFEVADLLPRMETIIPHSHKIYSTYLEKIFDDYLNHDLSFETHKTTSDTSFSESKKYYVKQAGSLRVITDKERAAGMQTGVVYYEELSDTEFQNQFSAYSSWKPLDIAYKLEKFDFGFVDVYPMYHRAPAKSRDEYNKLRYLNNKLAPVDHIKHKDATHE